MKELRALYKAAALEFVRDKGAIIFTVLLPVLLAGFFGLIFSGDRVDPTQPHTTPQYYVPGMMALGLLWLGVFGTAPPLVQLRDQQILRRLRVTPLRTSTLFGAQVAWRLSTGLGQSLVMVLFGMAVYGMRPLSAWWAMAAAAVLGAALMVALGFLLAARARSNESVIAIGQVVQFPMMFLSGTLFPLEMLPEAVRPVAAVMPLTYVGDALRQSMLGISGMHPLWLDFTVMGGFVIVLGGLALRLFRWD